VVEKPADGADWIGLDGGLEGAATGAVEPGLGTVRVVNRVVVICVVEVESISDACDAGAGPETEADADGEGEATSVMGQTVVLTAITSVVTWPILAGQSVTVDAQLVTVYVVVE
jgi:hypothetical protein